MDFKLLKNELIQAQYIALNDADAAVLLNDKTIIIQQAIVSSDIRRYLLLVNKLIALESSQESEAIESTRALDLFTEFDITDALVESKLISLLDALVVAALISASDKDYILALGNKTISRAEELGLGTVIEANVKFARTL